MFRPGPVNNYSTLKFTFPAVAATTDVPYASSLVNPPLKIYCRYCVRALLTRDLFATVSVTPQRYDGLIDAPTPADHTVKIPTQYTKGTDWQHCVIACVLPKGQHGCSSASERLAREQRYSRFVLHHADKTASCRSHVYNSMNTRRTVECRSCCISPQYQSVTAQNITCSLALSPLVLCIAMAAGIRVYKGITLLSIARADFKLKELGPDLQKILRQSYD